MSKRGLSMEEKKVKMLELFHENSEFFTIKELEKIAPKQKGIVQQSVKDVIDDLVGDDLVTMDKIGTGNCGTIREPGKRLDTDSFLVVDFWSFPSATGAMKTAAVSKSKKELDAINLKLKETQAELAAAQKGKEDTNQRQDLLTVLSQVKANSVSLKDELAAFGAADPVRYERKKVAVRVCKEAAQRWTDNTMILVQYAVSLGLEEYQVRAMLGMGEGWEDLPV